MYVMSKESCKKMDRMTIENIGIPSIALMENAANEVYHKISDKNTFTIICGTGNNGGDGLAIGRKLILNNKDVQIVIINPKEYYTNDFKTNLNILNNMKCEIKYIKNQSDINKLEGILKGQEVIIDCIFGVGLNKDLDSFYVELINRINQLSEGKTIAIDVPSGLDSNSGVIRGAAIEADVTYTFEVIKLGFIKYNALKYIGKLEVISIGIPKKIKEIVSDGIYVLDEKDYKGKVNIRSKYGHKGDYGKAVIVSGSKGFTGAAYITTEACVRTGTGLTTLITTEECQSYLSSMLIEAMSCNFKETDRIEKLIKDADVIAFGPGLSSESEYEKLLLHISNKSKAILVIDAEGINILSRRNDILEALKGRMLLTPHPGEMARLIKKTIKEVEEDRINIAKDFAKKYECILLLKGYSTVITNGVQVYINTTGDSKMASGGVGDCLTGIISSLIAQNHNPLDSALIGAFIHGKAAEIAGEGRYSIIATEIIEKISLVINNIIK